MTSQSDTNKVEKISEAINLSSDHYSPPHFPRSLGLKGVRNARHLGGYPTKDGKKVKDHLLLRTGRMNEATPEDIAKAIELYNLKTIVDFRTTIERDRSPDPDIAGVENKHLNVFGDEFRDGLMVGFIYNSSIKSPLEQIMELENPFEDVNREHKRVYRSFVTHDYPLKAYREFFKTALSLDEGSMSWHCSAGKDRAGIGTAIMLMALGVDWKLIKEDYLMSNLYFQERIDSFVEFSKTLTPREEIWEVARIMSGVDGSWFDATQDEIISKYGSEKAFLKNGLQLSDSDVALLKNKYLVK